MVKSGICTCNIRKHMKRLHQTVLGKYDNVLIIALSMDHKVFKSRS